MVAKAVRIISGIRAAIFLADAGFVIECYTLLRTISDFSQEIIFISEGFIQGNFNSSQTEFIRQFFSPFPTEVEALSIREKERYVRRDKIVAAKMRLAEKAGINNEKYKSQIKYISSAYDKYVHGTYETAMELFSGKTGTFMLSGHDSDQAKLIAKKVIAGKLHEVLVALEYMLRIDGNDKFIRALSDLRKKLERSEEYN